MLKRAVMLGLLTALIGVGGCGDDDDSESSSGDSKPATEKPAASKAPSELLGTYTATLEQSDLPPDPAPELVDGMPKWELTIANSGGLNGGSVFGIASAKLGSLEGPAFSISGDKITLLEEECAAGGDVKFYDNQYRYKLSGKTLTLTEVKTSCPDEVALTILTSQPWTKIN